MRLFYLLFYLSIFHASLLKSQEVIWSKGFGGLGENYPMYSVVDKLNNIYVAGRFDGEIKEDIHKLTSNGKKDIFVIKYNSQGNIVWTKKIGSSEDDFARGLVLNLDSNYLYITGRFQQTCYFGEAISGTPSLVSAGLSDAFLAKYDLDGNLKWSKTIGTGSLAQTTYNLKFDRQNNIIISGGFGNDIIFKNSDLSDNTVSLTNFIAKFDSSGSDIWSKKIVGKSASTTIQGVDVGEDGYYFSGTFKDSLFLDIDTLISTKNGNVFSADVFLYKTDFNGKGIWVKTIKGTLDESNISLTTDKNSNIYISGFFISPNLTFETTPKGTKGSNDIFFAKYNSNGNLLWTDTQGSIGDDKLTRLFTNGPYLVIAGQFGNTMTFNNETLTPAKNSSNQITTDALGIVHDENDNLLYAISAGGDNTDIFQTCVIDNQGNYIFIGDYTSKNIQFGKTTLTNTAAGTKDMFIAKYKSRSISLDSTSVKCAGTSTGSISANPKGAWVGNKTYSWTKLEDPTFTATTQNLENISAGTYTVRVADELNFETATIKLLDPAPLQITSVTPTDAKCYGSTNGTLSATVTGGTGAGTYKYIWSGTGTGVIANAEVQNALSAGTYSLTVTDANGCKDTKNNITVGQPQKVIFDAEVTKINGVKGSVILNVSGGSPAYTYEWSGPVPGLGTDPIISNLETTGNYTVTVTDSEQCKADTTVLVVNSTSLYAHVSDKKDVSCKGVANGSISIVVENGIEPITYLWTGPGFTSTASSVSGLATGTYSVIVTSGGTNYTIKDILIKEPQNTLSITASKGNPKCSGTSNGFVDANAEGGTLPYKYQWTKNNELLADVTEVLSEASEGIYEVTVTDANGCKNNASATLTAPNAIVALDDVRKVSCIGGKNDGAIMLKATGGNGVGNLQFKWSNGLTNDTIKLLSPGTYNVTISNADNSCPTPFSYVVGQPDPITASFTNTDVSCFGNSTGAIDLTPSSGNAGPFTFKWNHGPVTEDLTGLTSGTYSVIVSDSKKCEKSFSTTIIQPTSALSIAGTTQNVNCNGTATGNISTITSGGTSPHTWLWSNGSATSDVNNLYAGTYVLTVTDAKNCIKEASFTLFEPSPISVSEVLSSHSNISCFGSSTGILEVTASGSSGTYEYSLDGTTWQATGIFSNLSAGTYSPQVRDAAVTSCTKTLIPAITISQPSALAFATPAVTNITCTGLVNGTLSATAAGGTGTISYKLKLSGVETGNVTGATNGSFTGLASGTAYSVEATDANNCTLATSSQTITEPSALTLEAPNKTDITCAGLTNGAVNVSASGGTGALAYTLLLNDVNTGNTTGAASGNFTGLTAGTTYKVQVTDANNCGPVTSELVTIAEPQAIALGNVTSSDITCFGVNNGILSIPATGGTGALTYTLLMNDVSTGNTSGSASGSFTGLTAGTTYKVQVTDANNCGPVTSQLVTIAEPQIIALGNVTSSDITCYGANNGTLSIPATGGTGALSYTLLLNDVSTGNTSGSASGSFTGLTAGTTYKVQVTDANNCGPVTSQLVTIAEPQAIALGNVTSSDITCFEANNGTLSISATGGTGALVYTLLLNDLSTGNTSGSASGSFTGLTAGTTYKVQVTDANNCGPFESAIIAISEPQEITFADVLTTDITCSGENNGTANAPASGGAFPLAYTLLLDNSLSGNITGATSGNFTGLSASTYKIQVIDGNNCGPVETSEFTISEAQVIAAGTVTVSDVTCAGLSDGTAITSATGGNGTLTYTLLLNNIPSGNNTGSVSGSFTGIAPGENYTIQVNDTENCTPAVSASFAIIEPAAITISSEQITRTTGVGLTDGSINVSATGGTGSLSYTLNTGNPQSTGLFTGLSKGTYTVTITDANNCGPISSNSLVVDETTSVDLIKSGVIKLYPNPVIDKVNIEVKNSEFQELKIELKNINGQSSLIKVFENVSAGFITSIDLYQLPKGVYMIIINNIVVKDKLIIQ